MNAPLGKQIFHITLIFKYYWVFPSLLFSENIELKNGELTNKGFLELNQMEAEDNQGDTEDLWVTLSNMGYNKGLAMDEVSSNSNGL